MPAPTSTVGTLYEKFILTVVRIPHLSLHVQILLEQFFSIQQRSLFIYHMNIPSIICQKYVNICKQRHKYIETKASDSHRKHSRQAYSKEDLTLRTGVKRTYLFIIIILFCSVFDHFTFVD